MSRTITEYLNKERELYLPIVRSLITEQKSRYSGLTKEYAELLDHIDAYLLRGGKWHRPALALLGYRLAHGDLKKPIRNGLSALELMHRYILIHDDIIDRDTTRHGGPTLERVYAERFTKIYSKKTDTFYSKGMALVAGDVVNSIAYEALTVSGFEPPVVTAAVRGLNQLMMETTAGWQLQTEQNYMALDQVTRADIYEGMRLVSAQYSIIWPLRFGQIFAGRLTAPEWDPVLETYGLEAGLAFQITDDYLGMFGNETTTGKPVGHDYREGKKTLLTLFAYEASSNNDKAFLAGTLGTEVTTADVERARTIMVNTGALNKVKALAMEHADRAKAQLAQVTGRDPEAARLLRELADLLANRDR